jgi:hypothetical protein
MYSSQATVATERASPYLTQLGRHTGQMSRLAFHRTMRHGHGDAPPEVGHSEWSDTDAVVTFGQGRCTLHATDDALTLHAEADDLEQLRRIQDGITRRLGRIGRRDQLTVSWSPPASDARSRGAVDNPKHTATHP